MCMHCLKPKPRNSNNLIRFFLSNLCSTTVFDFNRADEFILSNEKNLKKEKQPKKKNLFVSDKQDEI